MVIGIDEAGRGPLAGPVVCACASIPENFCIPKGVLLADSKKLSAIQRRKSFDFIVKNFLWSVEIVDVYTIDRLNIRRASLFGMQRALRKFIDKYSDWLTGKSVQVMVDGVDIIELPDCLNGHCSAVVKGDGKVLEIACASIISKVIRDAVMNGLDRLYPKYGFAKHKGYATREHLLAIDKFGPCPVHRHSYRPVVQMRLW